MNITDVLPAKVRPYAKALAALLSSGGTAYLAVADHGVTAGEWGFVAASVLVTTGLVFGVRNDPKVQ